MTTVKPTKPGPYWYKHPPNKPELCLICKHGESLIVWLIGDSEFSHLIGFPDNIEWQPIEEPEEN